MCLYVYMYIQTRKLRKCLIKRTHSAFKECCRFAIAINDPPFERSSGREEIFLGTRDHRQSSLKSLNFEIAP